MIWLGVLIGLILGVLLCASVERFVDLGGEVAQTSRTDSPEIYPVKITPSSTFKPTRSVTGWSGSSDAGAGGCSTGHRRVANTNATARIDIGDE
jgi:hypothetical protein